MRPCSGVSKRHARASCAGASRSQRMCAGARRAGGGGKEEGPGARMWQAGRGAGRGRRLREPRLASAAEPNGAWATLHARSARLCARGSSLKRLESQWKPGPAVWARFGRRQTRGQQSGEAAGQTRGSGGQRRARGVQRAPRAAAGGRWQRKHAPAGASHSLSLNRLAQSRAARGVANSWGLQLGGGGPQHQAPTGERVRAPPAEHASRGLPLVCRWPRRTPGLLGGMRGARAGADVAGWGVLSGGGLAVVRLRGGTCADQWSGLWPEV